MIQKIKNRFLKSNVPKIIKIDTKNYQKTSKLKRKNSKRKFSNLLGKKRNDVFKNGGDIYP